MSRKKDLIYFVISKTNPNSEHLSLIRTFEILILKVCEDIFFPLVHTLRSPRRSCHCMSVIQFGAQSLLPWTWKKRCHILNIFFMWLIFIVYFLGILLTPNRKFNCSEAVALKSILIRRYSSLPPSKILLPSFLSTPDFTHFPYQ